jgi:hypothetical protein
VFDLSFGSKVLCYYFVLSCVNRNKYEMQAGCSDHTLGDANFQRLAWVPGQIQNCQVRNVMSDSLFKIASILCNEG